MGGSIKSRKFEVAHYRRTHRGDYGRRRAVNAVLGVGKSAGATWGNRVHFKRRGVRRDVRNRFIASWILSGIGVEIGFVWRIVIPGFGGDLKGRMDGGAGVGSLTQLQEQGERTIVLAVIRGFITEL
jgi:hypothetical protein